MIEFTYIGWFFLVWGLMSFFLGFFTHKFFVRLDTLADGEHHDD